VIDTQRVMVGPYSLEVSSGHIYLADSLPKTYDYLPWNVIGELISRTGLVDYCMIDIGANVGDTLAHFRRISSAPVICVEPSPYFFEILQRNALQFENVSLIQKLVAPKEMFGKVAFEAGGQTGFSRIAGNRDSWHGDYISFDELYSFNHKNFIIKSDTDGFDDQIIRAAVSQVNKPAHCIPFIYFEGPSSDQMRIRDFDSFIETIDLLQRLDYGITLFTNLGMPYAYCGQSIESVRSAFDSLYLGYAHGGAFFHYFDILAVQRTHDARFAHVTADWSPTVFRGA
jgi:FkbM family methyltransferase